MTMQVAVIGAGVGGLATAIGLSRAGADVDVHERATGPREEGSGLSLFGNGWTALDAIGAGDAVRAVAGDQVVSLTAGQRRPDGRWLATVGADAVSRLRIVHRAELHRVLAGLVPDGRLHHGSTVTGVRPDGEVALLTDDGSGTPRRETRRYDVVVAADGIRSRVRASWPQDVGIRYVGYSAWRGVTGRPVDLRGAAGETWGRGLRFGCAPLRDGRVYWFAVATMPAATEVAEELAHVRSLLAGWHAPIAQILDATDAATVQRLPVEELAAPLRTLRRGRCVLLGDAAHAMTPDLGQGANQALEDAAELTHLLGPIARHRTVDAVAVEEALAAYDRRRRARTQPLAARARRVGRVAQANGRIASAARDTLLRMAPSGAAARQLESVQAWTPGS